MIERDDWTDDPPDTTAPVPAKSQSISRPDWTDGPPEVPEPAPVKEQAIARPDWNETDIPVEVSKSETHPDWPLVPDEPETLEAAEQTARPAEQTGVLETMMAELAETGEHDLSVAHEAVTAIQDAVPIADRAGYCSWLRRPAPRRAESHHRRACTARRRV
jgi:hypothetical protein